jgi:hypothetical protein
MVGPDGVAGSDDVAGSDGDADRAAVVGADEPEEAVPGA